MYQRPQHLLSRFATQHRVFFVEEPVFIDGPAHLDISQRTDQLFVVRPMLPLHFSLLEHPVDPLQLQPINQCFQQTVDEMQKQLLDELLEKYAIESYILWYYTPMALAFSEHLKPLTIVYDCMDELSAFKNAPRTLREREVRLFERADIVFTGGQSLYEAKKTQHPHVYAFPSSVDAAHFRQAREPQDDPFDQIRISHPRFGFYGVIDERMDIKLLAAIADAHPDWQLVLIGPIVKINPAALPVRDTIHYLGPKSYHELPAYLSGWDVAILPFALNEATRFISPTKTLEYLAAGKPVVSTAIRDVVKPYGEQGLVFIGATHDDFIVSMKAALAQDMDSHQRAVDDLLTRTGWDFTWSEMNRLITDSVARHEVECISEDSLYV